MPSLLPTPNDYQQVLQHPQSFLGDPRLKASIVEKDPMGMPKVISGGFALTYQLEDGNRKWALRCFHKIVLDRENRYAAICDFISNHPSDCLVTVEYIQNGVLVKGIWYPITIMEWVDGDTLGNYLYRNWKNSSLTKNLLLAFMHVVSELERLKIAHGDLSQVNIIVRGNKLVLVDYDGMFVPDLSGKLSTELGNIHFQHPRRTEINYDHQLDRFSELVIYLTLKGLSINPNLYQEFGQGGEGLLFKREDFLYPEQSRLLKELEKISELRVQVQHFRQVCINDVSFVPSIIEFISNKAIELRSETSTYKRPIYITSDRFPTLAAINKGSIIENEGNYLTVIGYISDLKQSVTYNNTPYVFFNLGNWRKQCFTAVLWSETLSMLKASGKQPEEYKNKYVAVTGLVTLYENKYGTKPQIILQSPNDIEILTEEEAKSRLNKVSSVEVAKTLIPDSQDTSNLSDMSGYISKQQEFFHPVVIKDTGPNCDEVMTEAHTSLSIQQSLSERLNQLYSNDISSKQSKLHSLETKPVKQTSTTNQINYWDIVSQKIAKLFSRK